MRGVCEDMFYIGEVVVDGSNASSGTGTGNDRVEKQDGEKGEGEEHVPLRTLYVSKCVFFKEPILITKYNTVICTIC